MLPILMAATEASFAFRDAWMAPCIYVSPIRGCGEPGGRGRGVVTEGEVVVRMRRSILEFVMHAIKLQSHMTRIGSRSNVHK